MLVKGTTELLTCDTILAHLSGGISYRFFLPVLYHIHGKWLPAGIYKETEKYPADEIQNHA